MSDISNKILDAVEVIVNKEITGAKYDKTIQATIISCIDEQIGKYKIKYQGNIFIAYSSDTSKIYNNGTSVFVVIPENDLSKTKTIIGSVANKGIVGSSIITEEQRYEEIGIDCIVDNNTEPVVLSKTEKSMVLYNRKDNKIEKKYLEDVLNEEFKLNINVGKAFLLRATYHTKIQDPSSNIEYKFIVTCKVKDSNTTIKYVLSSKNMPGNPLMYSVPVARTRYFILSEELESIEEIELCYEGELSDNDNITINNLELIPCRYLDKNEITARHLIIKRPFGTQFTESKNSLRAQAELRENGRLVALDPKNIQYQWYIEKPDVVEELVQQGTYAGSGWEYLTTTEGSQPYFDYIQRFFPQSFRKIKCVLCYTSNEKDSNAITIYSAVSEFYDSTEKDDKLVIKKAVTENGDYQESTEHLFQSAQEEVFVKAEGKNDIKYHINWVYKDAYGVYKYADNFDKEKNILSVYSVVLNNVSRDYIACYYEDGTFIGQKTFHIGFTSEKNLNYTVNIINGDKVFIYNEYGLAPTVTAQTEKIVIDEISLNIIDSTGQIFSAETITQNNQAADNITWYIVADKKDRLIDFTNTVKEIDANGKEIEKVEEIDGIKYVYAQGSMLSYTLQEKYKTDANSNNIKIKIKYNNTIIWASTSIQCTKVGDPGVINGDYYIDIVEIDGETGQEKIKYINSFNYIKASNNNLYNALPLYLKVKIWNGFEWLTPDTINDKYKITWTQLDTLPLQEDKLYSLIEAYNRDEQNEQKFNCFTNGLCKLQPKAIMGDSNGNLGDIYKKPLAQLIQVKIELYKDNSNNQDNNIKTIEKTYYRTIPIAAIFQSNDNDKYLQIVDNSGFKYVKFDSAGYNPVYDTNRPFEVTVKDLNNNILNNNYIFNWGISNTIYNISDQSSPKTDIDLLKCKDSNNMKPQFNVSVNNQLNVSEYLCYQVGVYCYIAYSEQTYGYVYIPINIYKSNLDNAIINGWDGFALQMGTDNNGSYLVSNMIGAGSKDSSNGFSGVLLGEIVNTNKDKPEKEQGLMGYGEGKRTFFLNAKNGEAIFGSDEQGSIKISPGEDAIISASRKNGNNGMEINLSQNTIKAGNGNFSIDKYGHLTAKGATIEGDFSAGNPHIGEDDLGSKVVIKASQDDSLSSGATFTLYSASEDGGTRDIASINTKGFSFCQKEQGKEGWTIKSGIEYKNGKLTIAGELKATTGTIGGWKITDDTIESQKGDLILYSNGRIVGLGDNVESDDDEFIDIANKTINWKTVANGGWKNQNNKDNPIVNTSISSSGGSLSIDAQRNVGITSQGSVSMNCGNASMGLLNDQKKNTYGISISALSSGGMNPQQSVAANVGGKILETNNAEVPDGSKFNGFAIFNSTHKEDTDEGSGVYILTRKRKKTELNENAPEQFIILNGPEMNSNNKYVYTTAPTTLEDAIDFWFNNKTGKDANSWAETFNGKSTVWSYSTKFFLVPKTYSVVGIPPSSVTMSKDGDNYIIKEKYPEGVLLNVKDNTLKYIIHMTGKKVSSISFPNGLTMDLKGFNAILNVNCPYKK